MRDSLEPPATTMLRFDQIGYAVGDKTVLAGVSLELAAGAPTILLGPNGAGKTTFLKLAMGLLMPTAGSIGREVGAGGAQFRAAFVFQKPVMLRRSAEANIAFALAAAGHRGVKASARSLLDQVGLGHVRDRPARRLSGGEQQRLALARALARDPEILFLDEPTASLDPAATKAVEDIIAEVAARGVKVVMTTHDLGEARRLAGDIVFLSGGRLIEFAPASVFFTSPATEAARRFIRSDLVL